MTDQQQHPITPPPELVREWLEEFHAPCTGLAPGEAALYLTAAAARWGADQELEACCADVQKLSGEDYDKYRADWLRSMRRPKPKSQAEEAIKALDSVASDLAHIGEEYTGDIIRAALVRLRELEKGDE